MSAPNVNLEFTEDERRADSDLACGVAEEFTKLYFESFDKKRSMMKGFYLETAVLSWDGNPSISKPKIQEFLESLPAMEHVLTSLDAQPVLIGALKSQNQKTVLVQTSGYIRFNKDRDTKNFTQTFLITSQDNKWKIVSDCCRLQVPVVSGEST